MPWLLWAVMAKAGTRGSCVLETASTGFFLPLSSFHVRFTGSIG